MRKFKYVGSQKQAEEYGGVIPVIGKVYEEDAVIGKVNLTVNEWAEDVRDEWEEVLEEKTKRKFKYVGSQRQADGYVENIPVIGKVYDEDEVIGGGHYPVKYWASDLTKDIRDEWEEVLEEEKEVFDDGVNKYYVSNGDGLTLRSENEIYGSEDDLTNFVKEVLDSDEVTDGSKVAILKIYFK